MKRAVDWLEERAGIRGLVHAALDEPVRGGASMAYVFGSVLTFLLLLQMVTGVFLAMYYSPSATDAWASVAYIQDQVSSGWFVRGLHHHGASAMVVVAALHMLQTAIYGAYKRPRELNWIIGVAMFGLILAFALTGYLLPWDQTGFWATKVATGIAGGAPLIGQTTQELVQGGNEYGNLTITRFFAIHVFILPGLMMLLTIGHIYLFRRHGVTSSWRQSKKEADAATEPFWPGQMFRDMVAMAVMFAILIAVVWTTGGAGLDAPADPASNFQARPEWYFRPLFQLIEYFEGPMVKVVELGLPLIVGGVLIGLPFLDRGPDRSPRKRIAFLSVLGIGMAATIALTLVSIRADTNDPAFQKQEEVSAERASLARKLAIEHGVPTAGGYAVFTQVENNKPFAAAIKVWQAECATCHEGPERFGPEIGPGYNSRVWIRAFLLNPSGERFFAQTKIAGMEPTELRGDDLDAVVEFVYQQTGASDANVAKATQGQELFDDGDCSNCHESDRTSTASAPNLGGRGSVANLAEFIGMPSHEKFFGRKNEMPDYYNKFNLAERTEVAKWLVSLRDQPFPKSGVVQKAKPGKVPVKDGAETAPGDDNSEKATGTTKDDNPERDDPDSDDPDSDDPEPPDE